MRARLPVSAIVAVALGLTACAPMGPAALPAPSPSAVRPAEVVPPPPRVVAPVAPPPAPLSPHQPELPPPPPAPPAPAPVKPPPAAGTLPTPSPPVATSPPPAASPPSAPVPPAVPSVPQPRLQVSSAEEGRIQGEAQHRIDRTERLVKQIDERRLAGDQQQNLLTVQSFLVKAREALVDKDGQRALTLADKAFLLAEELVKVVR